MRSWPPPPPRPPTAPRSGLTHDRRPPAGVRVRPQRHRVHRRRAARGHRAGPHRADQPQRPATFNGFLHRLDQCTDPRLNIHLIMDNGSSHTSHATLAWITVHPRITVTYTPEHASWLDMANCGSQLSPAACCATASSPHPPAMPAISPPTPSTTIPRPPRPPRPTWTARPHDQHKTGGANPSRTYAGLHYSCELASSEVLPLAFGGQDLKRGPSCRQCLLPAGQAPALKGRSGGPDDGDACCPDRPAEPSILSSARAGRSL